MIAWTLATIAVLAALAGLGVFAHRLSRQWQEILDDDDDKRGW